MEDVLCPLSLLKNCLICSSDLDDQKPFLASEHEHADTLSQFERAFRCFCQLLNIIDKNVLDKIITSVVQICRLSAPTQHIAARKLNGDNEEDQSTLFLFPCCGECSSALNEIDRLQRTIKEIEANQEACALSLKSALLATTRNNAFQQQNDFVNEIRNQLVLSFQSRSVPAPETENVPKIHSTRTLKRSTLFSTKRAPSILRKKWKGKCNNQRGNNANLKLTSTFKGETSPPSPSLSAPHSPPSSPPCSLSDDFFDSHYNCDNDSQPASTENPDGGIGECLSHQNNSSTTTKNYLTAKVSTEEDALLLGLVRPCSVLLNKNVHTLPKIISTSAVKSATQNKYIQRFSLFSLITDNILLYRFTLINVSHGGSQFSCLEQGCSTIFQNPNSYQLFEQMQVHIDTVHMTGNILSPSTIRTCPICQEDIKGNLKFRSHFSGFHKRDSVVCESCWKPIRNVADNYRRHKWYHKNAVEQAQTKGGPPKKLLWIMKKRKRGAPWKAIPESIVPEAFSSSSPVQIKRALKASQVVDSLETGKRSSRGSKYGRLFSLITENILMYKCTLIQVSHGGTQFSCMESDCSTVLSDPNPSRLFERMHCHIVANHSFNCANIKKKTILPPCPLCQKGFEKGFKLRHHLISEHGLGKVVCESCWKPIRNTCDNYRRHEWSHKNAVEKMESIPPKKVMDRIKMKRIKLSEELSLEKNDSSPPLLSNSSSTKPEQAQAVKVKKKMGRPTTNQVHGGRYICAECGKQFSNGSNLCNHRRTHLPKMLRKVFSCPYCPSQLGGKPALANHIERLHRPDLRKFRNCPFCNKQYNKRDGYKFSVHVRSHTNERPYCCDKCGMAFTSTLAFQRHQTVHSEVRKFQCEFCEMNYKHMENLRRHRKTAHKDKVPQRNDLSFNIKN